MKLRKNHILYLTIGICVILILGIVLGENDKFISVFSKERKIPIYCVDTKDKKVAISFDTSWGLDRTDELLKILDKHKVKASFFVIGKWAEKFPDKVKAIYEKGHEIGNHSNTHPDMKKMSKDKIINEIAMADAKIMEITGKGTKLFRFPSGSYNDNAIEAVENTKHLPIQWSVDSVDWKEKGKDVEYSRVIKNTKPGSILLFHNNAKYTPNNLDKVIEKLKSDGYEFVKVSELLYKENYYIDNMGKQIKKK